MGYSSTRIIEIEEQTGIKSISADASESPLSVWYNEIRHKSLGELSDGDIARMIRQELYLQFVIWEALERLSKNPLAGDMYDWEILDAVSNIGAAYWASAERSLRENVVNWIETLRGNLDNGINVAADEDAEEYMSWLSKFESHLYGSNNLHESDG